jgi:hypothetical protein
VEPTFVGPEGSDFSLSFWPIGSVSTELCEVSRQLGLVSCQLGSYHLPCRRSCTVYHISLLGSFGNFFLLCSSVDLCRLQQVLVPPHLREVQEPQRVPWMRRETVVRACSCISPHKVLGFPPAHLCTLQNLVHHGTSYCGIQINAVCHHAQSLW